MADTVQGRPTFLDRVCGATNSHDVERIVECFTEDYLNETPAHPSRGFQGRDQVRRSWTRILAAVPDLEAEVVRSDQVGDTVWSEWEMRGTRRDGVRHLMRGVMIFTVTGDCACGVRFYLEPVDEDGVGADTAVQQTLTQARP